VQYYTFMKHVLLGFTILALQKAKKTGKYM